MLEAVNAPDGFAKEPLVREHLDRVRDYLRRRYAAQPLVNQMYVLWAAGKMPSLLTTTEREALLSAIRSQQQADGGWRTAAMIKVERSDHSSEPRESDGYATGLAVLAMEESGVNRRNQALTQGLDWLAAHQGKDGAWSAASINKNRTRESDAGLFMSDAATAYAVLALEKAR